MKPVPVSWGKRANHRSNANGQKLSRWPRLELSSGQSSGRMQTSSVQTRSPVTVVRGRSAMPQVATTVNGLPVG